jgi:hypothetical protein
MISTHSEYRAAACTETPAGANPTISADRLREAGRLNEEEARDQIRHKRHSARDVTRRAAQWIYSSDAGLLQP